MSVVRASKYFQELNEARDYDYFNGKEFAGQLLGAGCFATP